MNFNLYSTRLISVLVLMHRAWERSLVADTLVDVHAQLCVSEIGRREYVSSRPHSTRLVIDWVSRPNLQAPAAVQPVLRILQHCARISAESAVAVVKCGRMTDVLKRILDAVDPTYGPADTLSVAHYAARLQVGHCQGQHERSSCTSVALRRIETRNVVRNLCAKLNSIATAAIHASANACCATSHCS